MSDDSMGAIIIMDGNDLDMFVNLINEDYIESKITSKRYEIAEEAARRARRTATRLKMDQELAPPFLLSGRSALLTGAANGQTSPVEYFYCAGTKTR